MTTDDDPVTVIQRLVTEELHLLGRAIQDALPTGQRQRQRQVEGTLDEIERLVGERHRTTHSIPSLLVPGEARR